VNKPGWAAISRLVAHPRPRYAAADAMPKDHPHQQHPAVFLDRDDTLIRCTNHAPHNDLGAPDLVELLPGALEACRRLSARFPLFVITNQGGVARGRYAEPDVQAVHRRLSELLEGRITDYRYCPFHPRGVVSAYTREHPWRKPAPGMLLDLAQHHPIDLERSWLVGDAVRDCEAGKAAGCRTILVTDGAAGKEHPAADFIASGMLSAAALILEQTDGTPS
jgi:histidinol-phosphate phosphatase family protein